MARPETLAGSQIHLHGLSLKSHPPHQTVPKGIATIVSTYLQSSAPPTNLNELAGGAEVRATLRGPSLAEPRELITQPNTPFNIPPLGVPGIHTVENIRLVKNGEVLLRASPESVTIEVIEKLLVTQVTTRALTAQEIRERGIVFDASNFQAFNFAAAFAIQDQTVNIEFPVVLPTIGNVPDTPEDARVEVPAIEAPVVPSLQTIIPDTLKIQAQVPNLSVVGFMLEAPVLEDQQFSIPPIPGVIVIPGDIGFLSQFFSVMLMVGNVAPTGSNLEVDNVTADIVLPPGKDNVVGSGDDPLAMAKTAQGEVPRKQNVVRAGPDGKLGTSDDSPIIAPGETGNAEYLVEGRREGNHTIEMEINATLHGLPVGPVQVRGRAAGAVLVRNPNFTLTFTHPEVVNAGEPYTLDVTVTNTSESPANFVSVNLLPRNVSGATLIGSATQQIESLGPGDAATVAFALKSLRTGKVSTATLDSDDNVTGRFSLKAAIGELNVPLSPESLVLPKEANALPLSLRQAAVALLGKAYAVATAPAAALPKDVRRFSKKIVFDRGVEVAEAGFRVRLHEPIPDSATHLLLDFAGNNYARLAERTPPADLPFARQDYAAFDELRRRTVRGDAFAQAVAAELKPALQAAGVAAFHRGLAEKVSFRPGHISIMIGTAGSALPFRLTLVDPQGRRVGGTDASGKVLKDIPFSDFMAFRDGDVTWAETAVIAAPEPGSYTLVLTRVPGVGVDVPYSVSVVIPTASGPLRQIVHTITGRGPPTYTFAPGDPYRLSAEVSDGTGTDAPVAAQQDATIQDPPPSLLGVVQQSEADIVSCGIEPPTIPVGRVVAALMSEEVTRATAEDASHYAVDENAVLAATLQPGRRIVYLALAKPIGPFVPRTLTVTDLADNRGQPLSTGAVPIETTVSDEAGRVRGMIRHADGRPVPFATVRLFYWLGCELGVAHWKGISATQAGGDGTYAFDYVTRLAPARIVVTDPDTDESREVRFSVQRNAQSLNVDIVFLGRATFQGRTLAEDGTPLSGSFIKVTSLTDESQYSATSDAEGRFAIHRIPVGNILVETVNVAARARMTISELLPTAGGAVTRDITLLTPESPATIVVKKGDLSGHIFRADGTTPAATVPVVVYYKSGSQNGVTCGDSPRAGVCGGSGECPIAFQHTGTDGRFSFPQITSGELCVYSFDQGGLEQGGARIALPVDGARVDVLLSGGLGIVRGHVLDPNGLGVAGATVGGGLSLTTTDANGAFVLADVPVGRRDIVAVSEALKTKGTATIDLSRPGEEVSVTIVLESVGSIAGRVLAADGVTPIANNTVFLFRKEVRQEFESARVYAEILTQTKTNAEGRFRIDGVRVGAYELSAFRPDFKDGNVRSVALKFHGQVVRADVQFRGGGGKIVGRVTADDGQTPLAAKVGVSGDQVLILGGVMGVMFQTVQNFKIVDTNFATGEYKLDNVWVGPFTIRAAGQFSPDPIVVPGTMPGPGETVTVNIGLRPTSRVRGRIFHPDGVTPVGADFIVKYQSAAFQMICRSGDFGDEVCEQKPVGIQDAQVVTDADGFYEFAVVNAGAYTITTEDPTTGKVGRSHGAVRAGETGELDVRLLGVGRLTVEVLGSDALMIPGAKVEVSQTGFPTSRRTLTADADGRVIFGGGDAFSEGELVVVATDMRNGFMGRASGRITSDGENVTVRVFLYNATGTVFGTVFRSDHITRVPNAEYVLSNTQGALAFGVTDALGNYRVEQVPLGAFSVDVFEAATARRGYAAGRVDLAGQEVPANVFQDALGRVTGHGLESTTLVPLKGWNVALRQASPSGRSGPMLRAMTGVDGGFAFPGVSQGAFTVSIEKVEADGPRQASASGRIEREGQSVDIPLIVPRRAPVPMGSVDGIVFAPNGTPAANVAVALCAEAECEDIEGTKARRTTTDAAGRFTIAPVPLGRFAVKATAQVGGNVGTASGELSFDAEVAEVQVALVGLAEIRGIVELANGGPAPNVEVRLSGSPSTGCPGECIAFTKAVEPGLGTFAFHGVPARTFTVTARHATQNLKAAIGGVLNPAAGETREVRLVLEPTARLFGRVLLPGGEPARGIVAELILGTTPERRLYFETPSTGAFAFDAVPLVGYRLKLFDPIGAGEAAVEGQLFNDTNLGDVHLDDAAPSVREVIPAAGAVGVPREVAVRIKFSEPLAPSSVNGTTVTLVSAAGSLSVIREMSEGDTLVTVRPLQLLAPETTYTVRVKGVADRVGKPIPGEFTSTFTTLDLTGPLVVETSPLANAVGVSVESVVRIKYNEPVDPTRFAGPPIGLFHGTTPVTGNTSFAFGNTVIVFDSQLPLAEDTTYRVEIAPAADRSGNAQAQGLTYFFTTTDRTAPVVLALVPSGGGAVVEGATATATAQLDGSHDVSVVDFYINDVFALADRAAPYELTFVAGPTLAAPGQQVTVSAAATDVSGNRGTPRATAFDVLADTAPTLVMTAPLDGTVVGNGERVTVALQVSDDLGVKQVAFKAQTGRPQDAGTRTLSPPLTSGTVTFGFNVPMDAAPGREIVIEAVAVDTKGQEVASNNPRLRVADTVTPIVKITGASSGERLLPGQETTVVVTAEDAGAVKRVRFRASGLVTLDETRDIDPASPSVATSFRFTVPANAHPPQTATLRAEAVDASDNTGASDAVVLTVADRVRPAVRLRTQSGNLAMVPGRTVRVIAEAEDETEVSRVELEGSGAFAVSDAKPVAPPSGSAFVAFDIAVPAGLADGASLDLTAVAVDSGGNRSVPAALRLTVTLLSDVVLPASEILVAGEEKTLTVALAQPAPAGGLQVDFVSEAPAVVRTVPFVTFAAGESSKLVPLTGVAGGTTFVNAFVQGVQRASLTATVQGGVVRGTVYDVQLRPIANAQLTINGVGAFADAQGAFLVRDIAGPSVSIKAVDPITKQRGVREGIMNAPNGHLSLDVVVQPAGAVRGRVLQPDLTTPAGAGVKVEIFSAGRLTEALQTKFTDAQGRFEFPLLAAGEYVLEATGSADGNRGRSDSIRIKDDKEDGEEDEQDIVYLGRGSVVVAVFDGGGAMVPNAEITFITSHPFGGERHVVPADANGRARFDGVFIGSFSADARDPRTGLRRTGSGQVTLQQETVPLDLRLDPYGSVRGCAFRSDGATRVPGASVSIRGRSTTTGTDGCYEVAVLPLGTFAVSVSDPGTRGLGVGGGVLEAHKAVATADVTLFAQGTVAVTVKRLDASEVEQPVAGASVRLNVTNGVVSDSFAATTESDGGASLERVLAGTFTVVASHEGLSRSGSGTVVAGQPTEIELVLPRPSDPTPTPTGTIVGTVFAPDGRAPATGGRVETHGRGPASIGADGTFRFEGAPLGPRDLVAFDAEGRRRAMESVELRENGEIVTRMLTFVGLGDVGGRVLLPGGSSAADMRVNVRSLTPIFGGAFTAVTNAAGFYEIGGVALGDVQVTVSDPSRQLWGEGTGTLRRNGERLAIDVLLLGNVIDPTVDRYDGNNLRYPATGVSGAMLGGVGPFLDVVVDGVATRFAAEGQTIGEERNREVVTRRTFGALEVTRKSYVSSTGYFGRGLEIVRNTGESTVTLDLRLSNAPGNGRELVATSSGDDALQAADVWASFDDTVDADPFLVSNASALALVWGGAGSASNAETAWAGGEARYEWKAITLASGEAAAFVHFVVPQLTRAAASASASRLALLPPEALVGLSQEEMGLVRNFAMPEGGASLVSPLPSTDARVLGAVFEGAGAVRVGGATVRFRSESPFFGRTYAGGSDGQGGYLFASKASETSSTVLISAEPFRLEAVHPATAVVSPAVTGTFASGESTAAADIVFTNTGLLRGTVRRHNDVAVTSGSVTGQLQTQSFVRSTSIGGDAQYRFTGLPTGPYALTATTGPGLTGTATADVVAGQTVVADLRIQPTGAVRCTVRRGGTSTVGVLVYLSGPGPLRSLNTDTAGEVLFSDVAVGTWTCSSKDPQTGLTATDDVIVAVDATASGSLTFIGLGVVQVRVEHARGVVAPGAGVAIREASRGSSFRTVDPTNPVGERNINNVAVGAFTVRASHPASDRFRTEIDGRIDIHGQAAGVTVVLPPVGTVTGIVTRASGTPVVGATVALVFAHSTQGGTFTTTTGTGGRYTFGAAPMGDFTATVRDLPNGLFGETRGRLTSDNEMFSADIALVDQPATLPRTGFDANNTAFDIQTDGSIGHGTKDVFRAGVGNGAAVFEIVGEARLVGRDLATLEEDGQETVTFAETVGPVEVRRKVFTPRDGYFTRYLEQLRNTGSGPASVTLRLRSYARARTSTAPPQIVATSSGDGALDAADRWIVVDDDLDADPFLSASLPALAFVVDGPGGAEHVSSAAFDISDGAATTFEWNVEIPAGGTATYLHFVVQQLTRPAAQAAAERLVQLPPEAIAGLSEAERQQVRNFNVPSASALAPLPALDGIVTGRVLAVDATTPVPNAAIRFRSKHILFGRTQEAAAGADGAFTFTGQLSENGTTVAVPRHGFTVEATHPATNVVKAEAGDFGAATATRDIVFTNTGMIAGVVRHHDGRPVPDRDVTIQGVGVSFDGTAHTDSAGRFVVTGLRTGIYTMSTSAPHPQGTALPGSATVSAAEGVVTPAIVEIVPTGGADGTVTKGDGTAAIGLTIELFRSGFQYTTVTDVVGRYVFVDVPIGTYTVRAVEPTSGLPSTATAEVLRDAVTMTNLRLIGFGTLRVEAKYTNGAPVSGAPVEIREELRSSFRFAGDTGADGRITIAEVLEGAVTVRVRHPLLSNIVKEQTAGALVPGDTLEATVTLPRAITVPNVAEALQADAEAQLVASALAVGSVTIEDSDTVDTGRIIRQVPAAGEIVEEGTAVALVVSNGAPPVCFPRPDGMIGFWPGDGSTTDAVSGVEGERLNGAGFATGKVRQSFRFDEVDDLLLVPDRPALSFAENQDFTIEGWIHLEDPTPGDNWIAHKGDIQAMRIGQTTRFWLFLVDRDNRRLRFEVVAEARQELKSAQPIQLNRWTHVAAVRRGAQAELYIDGLLSASGPIPSGAVVNADPLAIGGVYDTAVAGRVQLQSSFGGRLDELAIFGRALTASELRSIYEVGAGGKCHTAGCVAPLSGMAAWWPARGTTHDLVGGRDAELRSGAAYGAGRVGKGFQMNGGYVEVPQSGDLDATGPFSIEAWFKGAPTGDQQLIVDKSHGFVDSTGWLLQTDSGGSGLGFGFGTGSAFPVALTSMDVLDGRFHHAVGTYDGTWIRLYVDGVLKASVESGPPAPNTRSVKMGVAGGFGGVSLRRFFNGVIDEVTFYRRPLAPAEVRALYQSGGAGKCAAPEAAELTSPVSGQILTGLVTLSAQTPDEPTAVSRIEVLRDGGEPIRLLPPTFTTVVDTAAWSEGPHVLKTRAVNAFDATVGAAVEVAVNNQLLSIDLSPTPGTAVRDRVTVRAVPSEVVRQVELFAGARRVVDAQAPYETTFDLADVPPQNLPIGALATGYGETATASSAVFVDQEAPPAPDRDRIEAREPDIVLGRPGAVENNVNVEATHVASGRVARGRAASDGSFALSLPATRDDLVRLVAVDDAGNRSDPTDESVLPPLPIEGPIAVSFYGRLVDRVRLSELRGDDHLDGVFAISLNVGAGITRRLVAIDVDTINTAEAGRRSTRGGESAILGVATDLGALFANSDDGAVDLSLTAAATLLLIVPDEGFIQHGRSYSVTATFADGSRFAGTLASLEVPLQVATSPVFAVRNLSLPAVAAPDTGEATSAVVSVKNLVLPTTPPSGDEAGEASSAVVSVKNVDGLPPAGDLAFTASEYFVSEGAPVVSVTVTRTGGAEGTVAVDYRTVEGSALAGSDFVAASGRLVFAPGETSRMIAIALRDDQLFEATETLQVVLSRPVGGAALGVPSTATIRIQDDEVLPVLTVDDLSVAEGDGGTPGAMVTVRLSAPATQDVTVAYTTSPITASPGIDYVPVADLVTFTPGAVLRTVAIPLRGDMRRELDETFEVRLSGPSGAVVADATAIVTIVNDDVLPTCVTAPAGLVGWWALDGNGVDVEGGADAARQGGVGFTTGYVRQGMGFDGVDDAAVADDARLPAGAAPRTLELWMKPESDARVPVFYGGAAVGDAFYVRVSGDVACIGHGGTATPTACGTTDVTDGQWHHVALTYDGAMTARLYVDGQFEIDATQAYATTRTGRLILGSTLGASPEYFRGQIDEVSVYDRALTDVEIEAIVRADNEGKCCHCANAPAGLVGAWSADGNADDRIGTNDGVASAGLTFAAGQVGTAFALNGSNAYVEVPASPSLDPPVQFSVELWVQPLAPTSRCVLYKLDNGIAGAGWGVIYDGVHGGPELGHFQIVSSDQNVVSAAGPVPFGQWTHLAGTSDGTTMRFYVNGVEATPSASPQLLPGPTSLLIGACQRNGVKEQFFNGRIDEVNIYHRALSGAEIRSIVNAGRAGICR